MKTLLAWTSILTALVVCLALSAGQLERYAVASDEVTVTKSPYATKQSSDADPKLSKSPYSSSESPKKVEQEATIQKPKAAKSEEVSSSQIEKTAPNKRAVANKKEIKAGLWNEGKAVFSDVKVIDTLGLLKYARGYKPTQPIKFSHVTHVKQNKMECTYCHSGVTKSPYATIPAVETCMGCHKAVKTESPEIQKLTKYYEEGKPIPWEPVHHLPEHVYFTHERHIKAGVGCQSCHGQVPEMEEVEKVSSLKMGFCVSCHRENGASIDCLVCHQ